MKAHYFLGLGVAEEVRDMISQCASSWKKQGLAFKQWTQQEDYHITLHFFGGLEKSDLDFVQQSVESLSFNERSITQQVKGLHYFGKPDSPRILWADPGTSPALKEVHKKVTESLADAGFSVEKRPFTPHITIAKNWEGKEGCPLKKMEEEVLTMGEGLAWECQYINLYQIHPGKRPKYEIIEQFPLETGAV
ncbi:RNA 2',3'-cyclic phosphodiesterase [Salsuginibacillus kocurii]|uniref:RNA 2',3'-cyclic phosphodiesterase n=1 Tax=Salsuginibacillus kocurii TaxID=427078 RepID=UPI0003814454|nr:RNA 2',3'-cyclic phosphodiesterase [Salsuginibacillus kocurii]